MTTPITEESNQITEEIDISSPLGKLNLPQYSKVELYSVEMI